MAERLAGKVALVSGGARGMGASHVRSLVAEGAKVVFGDILDDEGKAVAAEVGEATRYLHLDVTKPEDWDAAVATALAEFGRIDVLVNNAGIINIGTLEDYALSEWQRILDINLTGVFLGIRAVVKPMKKAGRGSIINISSIEGMAGTIACHGYTATKFAVRGLTKSAALELGPSGIRVNSIHPGLIKTPMTEWVPEDIFQSALGRAAEPKEVSNLVVYLASDESSYSTGSEFVVDGGTGSVVTSAGLVFAFTMMTMAVSELTVIGQVGTTIGLGLLFDTLIVRSLMTPSIAALLGKWFWWPQRVRQRPVPSPWPKPAAQEREVLADA